MTKEKCRLLRRQGHSIGEIARKLQLSESTVHWHVSDIKLTGAQRRKLFDHWCSIMAKVNARRRGHALRPVVFFRPQWSVDLIHLVAHLSFDGRIDRYGCYYYSKAQAQALHVRRLVKTLLGVSARMRCRLNGIWVVSYCNVEVMEWLLRKERELLHVMRRRQEWVREWLRALFDDEGHVYVAKGIRRVRASQDDARVLKTARQLLLQFRIRSRIERMARAIEITGKENLVSFRKQINFSRGISINEHRQNGIWKRPLEKRELLDMALASYSNGAAL